jgi:hypothetical protein
MYREIPEDCRQAAIEPHAVEAPTRDVPPPGTATAGLEPITEEAGLKVPFHQSYSKAIARDSLESVGGQIK